MYICEKTIKNHIEAIKCANSNISIKNKSIAALSELGYDNWIFGSESHGSLFGFATLASGKTWKWLLFYMGKGYFNIDPVVKHCRETSEPFYWDAMTESNNGDSQIKRFWKDVFANGFSSGLSVPLKTQSGLNGLISIVSDRPLEDTKRGFSQNLASIRLIGEAMHVGVERLMRR